MRRRRSIPVLAVGALLSTLCACGSSEPRAAPNVLTDDAITVGAFDFTESHILAELYGQALEAKGYNIVRAFDLGPREFVAPALARGLVELLPEYAGTASRFLSLDTPTLGNGVADTHTRLVQLLDKLQIKALEASPAQNANTFVVTRETAERLGINKLSDLAAVTPALTLGGPPECVSRAYCLLGLQKMYGVSFDEFVALDAGGPVTRQALRNGHVDVALMFTTDPAIGDEGLLELADDRGLQPAENITPLVRNEVVDRWGPDIVAVIDAVSRLLTTEALTQLNANASVDGADVATVAAEWLRTEGPP